MRRQREKSGAQGKPDAGLRRAHAPRTCPISGRSRRCPTSFMAKHFAFSRVDGQPKQYVQDKLREEASAWRTLLQGDDGYIYICGLKAMEHGVEEALADIARGIGLDWVKTRDRLRDTVATTWKPIDERYGPARRGRLPHEIRVGWGDCDPAKIAYTGRCPISALQTIDAWWEHLMGYGWFEMNLEHGLWHALRASVLRFPVAGHAETPADLQAEAGAAGHLVAGVRFRGLPGRGALLRRQASSRFSSIPRASGRSRPRITCARRSSRLWRDAAACADCAGRAIPHLYCSRGATGSFSAIFFIPGRHGRDHDIQRRTAQGRLGPGRGRGRR
jgi:hypothetical protein